MIFGRLYPVDTSCDLAYEADFLFVNDLCVKCVDESLFLWM